MMDTVLSRAATDGGSPEMLEREVREALTSCNDSYHVVTGSRCEIHFITGSGGWVFRDRPYVYVIFSKSTSVLEERKRFADRAEAIAAIARKMAAAEFAELFDPPVEELSCVEQDFGDAHDFDPEWIAARLREGAEAGHAQAQFELSLECERAGDDAEAVHWLHLAAEQGIRHAQFLLGCRYRKGDGVGKNAEQSASWYRRASDSGHSQAQCHLGSMYWKGVGVNPDPARAVALWRMAARHEETPAYYGLGLAYESGEGVPKDLALAVMWWRKAADLYDEDAMYKLGCAYWDGLGVARDPEQAVHWWKEAESLSVHLDAQYKLGCAYWDGIGAARDLEKARCFWRAAASDGHSDSIEALKRFFPENWNGSQDLREECN